MSDSSELSVQVTLVDLLKKWSRQVGYFEKNVLAEIREKKYLDSLLALFGLFAVHHAELSDSDFARNMRFFTDAGLAKRLSPEAPISIRYAKLERIEPDMIKDEPLPEPKSEIEIGIVKS